MIPKTIHYCWFGGNELNELSKKCIDSWKKYCPDYEIIEWNENNFDINSNPYVKEAFEAKKYAFVTDYVRLYVLNEYGGIYMDTDVELLKSIDYLLVHHAFSGFENSFQIPTAIMGAEKGNEWISYLLSYYDNRHFIKSDGSYDMKTNVYTITEMTAEKYNIRLDNTFQDFEGVFTIYPNDYFCPKDYKTLDINLTENSTCIHHFNGSWHSKRQQAFHKIELKAAEKYKNDRRKKERYIINHSRLMKIKLAIIEFDFSYFINVAKKIVRAVFKRIFNYTPVKNILFFESEGDYTDNCYAFYKYLLDNGYNEKYKLVWKVKNPELYKNEIKKNVYFVNESSGIKYYYFLKNAKYIFFTHPWWLTKWKKSQTVVNFWHGIPIKNPHLDISEFSDDLLISSKNTIYNFAAFNKDTSMIKIVGTPRLDVLSSNTTIDSIVGINLSEFDKLIMCMPTFKKSVNWTDADSYNTFYINTVNSIEELNEINDVLSELNILMIVKLHHLQIKELIECKNLTNIIYLTDDELFDNGIQLYELLSVSDALITDFSSVFFDYLLKDNQIGFLVNDLSEYSRGFIIDNVQDFMAGQKIYNNRDLISFFHNVHSGNDQYKSDRERVLNYADDYQDNNNCKRIADYYNLII